MSHELQTDADREIWVVSLSAEDDLLGRLGDARDLADRCAARVVVLRMGASPGQDSAAQAWIEHGADEVRLLNLDNPLSIDAAMSQWQSSPPLLVMTSADRVGRAWSARLAARTGWTLVSPTLLVQRKSQRWVVTRLDGSGRRACQIELHADRPAIVALRPGVAQALPTDGTRRGVVHQTDVRSERPHRILSEERLPPDPRVADIRHLPKLIAGGQGVGGRAGFDSLRRVAESLGAGVAASRMAVDLGWIDAERQVGQTGKTVCPELYLACGISGASHHLEGMSASGHVVAINTDPNAPLMQFAELAIQADLHPTLRELQQMLDENRSTSHSPVPHSSVIDRREQEMAGEWRTGE